MMKSWVKKTEAFAANVLSFLSKILFIHKLAQNHAPFVTILGGQNHTFRRP